MTDALDDALVEFLYRWNCTEKPYGFSVLDIDLLQQAYRHPEPYRDRTHVGAALKELADGIDTTADEYVAAKIGACQALYEVLEGARPSFSEYVSRTLDVVPQLLNDDILQQQHDANTELLDALGVAHSAAGVTAWRQANALDGAEVEESFRRADAELVPLVQQAAGIEVDVDYRVDITAEDAYWINWTCTNDLGEFLVRFNTHPRHFWMRGHPEYLALHEVGGHAVQMVSWRRQIEAGNLPRSVGLVCIFTPDMFLAEGLAEALPWLIPDLPLSPEGRWASSLQRMEQLAWNNGHLMANDGASKAEVLAYVERWAPGYVAPSVRASDYAETLSHPLLRGYKHAYGVGGWRQMELAARCSAEDRQAFLRRAYSGPMTASAIMAWPGNSGASAATTQRNQLLLR